MAQTKSTSKKAPKKETKPPKITVRTTAEIKAATDALLDEIDTVLEDACEATQYRQKGGE